MAKNRFISFIILIVAVAFSIYVVVDNLPDEEAEVTSGEGDRKVVNESEEELDGAPIIAKDEEGLLRGMFAPNFTLPIWGSDKEMSLSDFRGEIVVLNLWASWCPPCRDEMPDLIKLDEEFKDQGVNVVGINMATLERSEGATEEFMEEYQVTFPNFVDQAIDTFNQRGIVESLYQVRAIPATYILDQDGRIFIPIRGKVNYEMLENEVKKLLQ
ncbi:TlpA disulfide reductase family protein [Anaerobacillus isosaccharinicus]|uniref:TlpA family protein disulfide reductase n=1 Tax=Anaerobacillus isosaccharinicus TaxID=1532552 RepID=A0A1S2L8Y5_9BACI|nr:TlpA disulfide reductase family protein [Anaerobacillus isosaccharinicus]MBA5585726.1 TlpA family protein disulfide reductase [Anaerobacillus isosaccharinicus]QOY35968.1 TlpA family protein disulfide reductase [Anaerobacillus isosaccharinicus]